MRGFAVAAMMTIVAMSTGTDAFAQEEGAEWLFVQTAESVTLADGVLTLQGVSPATLFFSDRPERISAHGLTSQFVTYWQNLGDDSFGDDPPNATLAIIKNDEADDVVLTLMDPKLDGNALTYAVTVLEGEDSLQGGPCSLFVDPVGMPLTPVSAAGVRRRTIRRVALY